MITSAVINFIESKPKGPISIVNFNLQNGQLKDPKGPRLARGPRSGDV